MKKEYKFIYEGEESQRIDKWLSEVCEYSRSVIQRLIKDEALSVNGKNVKSNYKVQTGDVVEFVYSEEEMLLEPQEVDFEIVYEDNDLIIVNKPLGLVVHPGVGNKDMTLVNGLLHHFENLSDIDSLRPGIVHRIDKNTTGLLVVAKNNSTHIKLQEMIKNREVKREYIALVHGNISHDTGTIEAPIGRSKLNRQQMCVCEENSKHATTHFDVLGYALDFTLIKCKLETGRTHQIRVHMKYINHPIVGDPVYGQRKTIGDVQLLHAYKLSFNHPQTNEEMNFYAKLPEHFVNVIESLNVEMKEGVEHGNFLG